MKNILLIVTALMVSLCSMNASSEPADFSLEEKEIKNLLPVMIKYLETGREREFIEQFLFPEDLEKLKADKEQYERAMNDFVKREAALLKSCLGEYLNLALAPSGDSGDFVFKGGTCTLVVRFTKLNGKWYLKAA